MTVQVEPGQTIKASKVWRNNGAAGYRDVIAMYGQGTGLADFLAEIQQIVLNEYAGAGVEVTTLIYKGVPYTTEPGKRDALVGVGKYDIDSEIFTCDDYEVVPDAIEVVAPAPPPMVTITVSNKNAPANAVWWAGLTSETILECPFTPIDENFVWTIYEGELCAFLCFDAHQNVIDTPNSGIFLWWGTFLHGRFYTWNFALGRLEGQYKEWWIS